MKNVVVERISNDSIDWPKAYEYFKGYTHVDVNEIPEVYEDYVLPMKEIFQKEAVLKIKYGIAEIVDKDTDRILLEDQHSFTGKMIGKAYEDAEKIILYVVSVLNMEDLIKEHPDMMDSFFLEYWAVSVLNAIRESFYEYFKSNLMNDDQKLTFVWSPGQSKFELSNQSTLFALLKPEDMGVRLDKHMRMIPLKSVSGTIGIVSKDSEIELISCDYCEHAKTCPGYAGKKYADIGIEQRRI